MSGPSLGSYLFLEVVVSKVKDLQSSVSPGQGQPLTAAAESHGPDSTGHVVEEPNPVHLKISHFNCEVETHTGSLSEEDRHVNVCLLAHKTPNTLHPCVFDGTQATGFISLRYKACTLTRE